MNLEEEIARAMSTAHGTPEQVAAHLMPLVKRAQAEAVRGAARFLRGPDNPQRGESLVHEKYAMDDAGYQLFRYADRIEREVSDDE